MNCEQFLHLYISCEYKFRMFILGKNIYITIDNISVSEKGSCPKDVLDILQINFDIFFYLFRFYFFKILILNIFI